MLLVVPRLAGEAVSELRFSYQKSASLAGAATYRRRRRRHAAPETAAPQSMWWVAMHVVGILQHHHPPHNIWFAYVGRCAHMCETCRSMNLIWRKTGTS